MRKTEKEIKKEKLSIIPECGTKKKSGSARIGASKIHFPNPNILF